MNSYILYYRLPGQFFRRKLKNVTYNFIEFGVWVIVFIDGREMCLPLSATLWAGVDRHLKYKSDDEKKHGLSIPTDPGGNA